MCSASCNSISYYGGSANLGGQFKDKFPIFSILHENSVLDLLSLDPCKGDCSTVCNIIKNNWRVELNLSLKSIKNIDGDPFNPGEAAINYIQKNKPEIESKNTRDIPISSVLSELSKELSDHLDDMGYVGIESNCSRENLCLVQFVRIDELISVLKNINDKTCFYNDFKTFIDEKKTQVFESLDLTSSEVFESMQTYIKEFELSIKRESTNDFNVALSKTVETLRQKIENHALNKEEKRISKLCLVVIVKAVLRQNTDPKVERLADAWCKPQGMRKCSKNTDPLQELVREMFVTGYDEFQTSDYVFAFIYKSDLFHNALYYPTVLNADHTFLPQPFDDEQSFFGAGYRSIYKDGDDTYRYYLDSALYRKSSRSMVFDVVIYKSSSFSTTVVNISDGTSSEIPVKEDIGALKSKRKEQINLLTGRYPANRLSGLYRNQLYENSNLQTYINYLSNFL